jgi:hypothetical protein
MCSTELRKVVDSFLPRNVTIHSELREPDIVHVPHQISISELSYLRGQHSATISVAWLDFIATRRRGYHKSDFRWLQSQRSIALALDHVDGIVWLSDFVKRQANAFGWGLSTPSFTVSAGVDHLTRGSMTTATPPRLADSVLPGRFCVLIAAALPHKNRVLAIEAFLQTPELADFTLVLAGNDPGGSLSTRSLEQTTARRLSDGSRVKDLGLITNPELEWLYKNGLFSIAVADEEGFGIVPFESAFLDCACVTTQGATAIDTGNPLMAKHADVPGIQAAFRLALQGGSRTASIDSFKLAAQNLSWHKVGEDLAMAFESFGKASGRPNSSLLSRFSWPKLLHKAAWEIHPFVGRKMMNTISKRHLTSSKI